MATKKTRHQVNQEIYQRVTDTIIERMENGEIDWLKPFASSNRAPLNVLTGNEYKGINRLQLSLLGDSAYFATYKQWQQMGAQVQRGETAIPCVKYGESIIEKENKDTGKKETFVLPYLKTFSVFSINQVSAPDHIIERCEGLEPKPDQTKAIKEADTYIERLGVPIRHQAGGRAYYSDATNMVTMPSRNEFIDNAQGNATQHYYSTLFHEITHWTGSDLRCGRKFGKRFGDADYAFEELVAELGAAFHCQARGIDKVVRDDHVAYLQSWIKACRKHPDAIFKAAALAEASLNYCDSLQSAEETPAAA